MTKEDVLTWLEEQNKETLTAVADYLIDRDFACDPEDLTELEHELARREEGDELEPDLISEARDRLRRREYGEALHALVRALGPDFDALENIPLAGAA